jgi:hypothetical protein
MAKNPVDHPMGGAQRGKGHIRSRRRACWRRVARRALKARTNNDYLPGTNAPSATVNGLIVDLIVDGRQIENQKSKIEH